MIDLELNQTRENSSYLFMNLMFNKLTVLFCISILLASWPAFSLQGQYQQELTESEQSIKITDSASQQNETNNEHLMQIGQWQLQLAVGYGKRSALIVGEDDFKFYVAPNITYYGEQFFFDNGTLGYTLHQSENLAVSVVCELNPFVKYFDDTHLNNLFFPVLDSSVSSPTEDSGDELMGSDDDSNDGAENAFQQVAEQLTERKWSADIGLQLNYFFNEEQQFNIKLMRDVSGLHQGWRLSSNWSMSISDWLPENLYGQITLGLDWIDDKSADYYFSHISPEEYYYSYNYQAKSAFIPSIAVNLKKPITEQMSVVFYYKYQALGDGIKNSSIVKSNDIITQFIGVNYAF